MNIILWCIMSLIVGLQYAYLCNELPWYKQLLVSTIFLIAGPAFLVTQIAEAIFDVILPEGWDNDK